MRNTYAVSTTNGDTIFTQTFTKIYLIPIIYEMIIILQQFRLESKVCSVTDLLSIHYYTVGP